MKMCWWSRRSFSAYQDGALGARRTRRVARHLLACPACQRELQELQAVTLLLRSLPSPSRAPEYWPGALQRLRGKTHDLPRQPMRSAWLEYLRGSPENPVQALVPVGLLSMALFSAVMFLGLEDEAFAFFTSYFLSIVLE
jgi:anti-sigma factor RsiW